MLKADSNFSLSREPGPIGVFDSGYGGLTILHGIRQLLPQYDYLYLGDNARAPYGPSSRVFSNTTVQKHQFFSAQLSL